MRIKLLLLIALISLSGCASMQDYSQRRDVQPFVQHMVKDHGFSREQVLAILHQAQPQPQILQHMGKPHEHSPWYVYQRLFLTPQRIKNGGRFWRANASDLARASEIYGVPPEIIVAILGVETNYGRFLGQYRVLDALATLAFDYPPRGAFFQSELGEFMLLAQEQNFDPLTLKGSYAGAMGQPQFMPSSYRRYAVDFDGDKRADLFNDPADAIGSIANYFKAHGWQAHQAVIVPATVNSTRELNTTTNLSLQQWAQLGVHTNYKLPPLLPAKLIILEGSQGPEYWLSLHNFAVIMQYNKSPLYALAVYQLSQAITKCYHETANVTELIN